MDQIKELVLSWQMKEVSRLVKSDESVLDVVIDLLGEEDDVLRLRALSVLDDLLGDSSGSFHRKVLVRGFDQLTDLLLARDDRIVMRTLLVLRKLIENTSLTESQLTRLLNAVYDLAPRGKTTWIGILDLISSLSPGYYSSIDGHVARFLSSDDICVSSIGLKLAASTGYALDGNLKHVGRVFSEILDLNDVLLLEVAFDSMVQMLTTPSQEIIEVLLRSSYFRLSVLATSHEDILVRSRVREILKLMRSAIMNYYGKRPDDAIELAKRLREEGFTEEAILLEQILPAYYWNASTVSLLEERTGRLPRFLREL
ncbi:hypothetical protein [Thermococcus aciditolerans]|uniref:Uncharacterized protein n=1 Tax=Thermococcus aciditolerans TaxID=2598455 RepID=A0A5C0SNB4_9EURY|nr:hypothetical protein [Thermococcus aciditolerans]QEK14668.1 hypothetical protein FPV09_05675 [Thermococcus aciditolerans]